MPLPVRILLAAVWIAMGLGAKVLGLVPRHQEIVARILGDDHAATLTVLIGLGEIGIGFWVFSNFRPKLCAIVQIVLVGLMNLIEFTLARDLLLFGAWNLVVAFLFMATLAYLAFARPPACSPR